jgi:hypothetical protein
LKTFDEFTTQANLCSSVDEFNELLQASTYEWALSNYFVEPIEADQSDPKGWFEFVTQFWEKSPLHFEKKPRYKNGHLFVYCAAVRAEYDQFQERSGEYVLEDFKTEAFSILSEFRSQIVEAKTKVMPMYDFMAIYVSRTQLLMTYFLAFIYSAGAICVQFAF